MISTKTNIQRDFENKRTTYYRDNYESETHRNFVRRLRRDLIEGWVGENRKFDKVLDIGCGPAILYRNLLAQCRTYYAVDLVQSNIEEILAVHDPLKVKGIVSDMDRFEFSEDYFDVIVCAGTIEYTDRPKENLLKLVKSLRQDGILLITFPNLLSPYRLWGEYIYRHLSDWKNSLLGRKRHYYPRALFKESDIRELLSGLDLTEVAVQYFGYKLILAPFDSMLPHLDFRIARWFQSIRRKGFEKMATEFLLAVRK